MPSLLPARTSLTCRSQRLLEGEVSLKEGTAADGTLYKPGTELSKGTNVLQPRYAAGGDDGKAGQSCHAHLGIRIDTRLHAVTSDIGKDQMSEPHCGKIFHEPLRQDVCALTPAVDPHPTVLGGNVGDE